MKTKISERLQRIQDFYGIKNMSEFARKAGLLNQTASNYLKGTQKPDIEKLSQIKQSFDEINADWLLTGRGEMLKDSIKTSLDDFDKVDILRYIIDNQEIFKTMKSFPLLLNDIKEESLFNEMKNRMEKLEREMSLIRNSH